MVRNAVVQLLFFVVLVSAAGLIAGAVITESTDYADSIADAGDRDADRIDTELEIINDPAAGATYNQSTEAVTLYVKNVGGRSLDPAALDVVLDGSYVEPASRTVVDGDHWGPGAVLAVRIDTVLQTGPHRAVVQHTGAEAVLGFDHRIAFFSPPAEQDDLDDSDCEDDTCTVYLNETPSNTTTLQMETDPVQADETVTYASSNQTVGTLNTSSGVTDAAGQDEVTVELNTTGTTVVSLDTGWDDDDLTLVVEESQSG
jgi:flagellar protein FlaG